MILVLVACCIALLLALGVLARAGRWRANQIGIAAVSVLALGIFGALGYGIFQAAQATAAPDSQCTTTHDVASPPPTDAKAANDFLNLGDYDYDRGDCVKAIADYSRAIALQPNYPEAFNNRAYTYMRMQNYRAAATDLEAALALRPDYINALMNQGDLYNYYGPTIDRQKAIAIYNRVIALGGARTTSVCGHRAMAESGGAIVVDVFRAATSASC